MRRIEGLQSLARDYDAVFCDVWGVVHNGVASYGEAVDALSRFRGTGGTVLLLTNAPRPAAPIREQLTVLGAPPTSYDHVVTSGDVTRAALTVRPGVPVLHIGPERDLALYDGLDLRLAGEDDAEIVSATGLIDDEREQPEDYRERLRHLVGRGLPMVCANPDIVVERGGRLLWCAGALARLYEELGGRTVLAGKPHPPIYEAAFRVAGNPERRRVLVIGDGLPTDAEGARNQSLDLLFVTGGIHAAEFGATDTPDTEAVAKRLGQEGIAAVGFLPRLRW